MQGYQVIFLARSSSIMPFTKSLRQLSFSPTIGFDFLSALSVQDDKVVININQLFLEELQSYQKYKNKEKIKKNERKMKENEN